MLYNAIYKSRLSTDEKKILIGESTAFQLYPNTADYHEVGLYSLTTSHPSTIIGSYILIQNLAKHNDLRGREVIYICIPSSLDQNIYNSHTFNHFVKPFNASSNKIYFSSTINGTIKRIPYSYLSQVPFIKTSQWSPEWDFCDTYTLKISDICIEYLKKLKVLSHELGFKFRVIQSIRRIDTKNEDHSLIKEQIKQNGLEDIFIDYFNNVKYLPTEEFMRGQSHYLEPSKYGLNPLDI